MPPSVPPRRRYPCRASPGQASGCTASSLSISAARAEAADSSGTSLPKLGLGRIHGQERSTLYELRALLNRLLPRFGYGGEDEVGFSGESAGHPLIVLGVVIRHLAEPLRPLIFRARHLAPALQGGVVGGEGFPQNVVNVKALLALATGLMDRVVVMKLVPAVLNHLRRQIELRLKGAEFIAAVVFKGATVWARH